jgi:hypothetical protein
MDRFAKVLDVLGGHDPCDGTDCGYMVSVPATALVRYRLCCQVSRQSCGEFPGSRTKGQVGHSWVDVGSLKCHACLLEKPVWSNFNVIPSFESCSSLLPHVYWLHIYSKRSFGTSTPGQIVQLYCLKGKGWVTVRGAWPPCVATGKQYKAC